MKCFTLSSHVDKPHKRKAVAKFLNMLPPPSLHATSVPWMSRYKCISGTNRTMEDK